MRTSSTVEQPYQATTNETGEHRLGQGKCDPAASFRGGSTTGHTTPKIGMHFGMVGCRRGARPTRLRAIGSLKSVSLASTLWPSHDTLQYRHVEACVKVVVTLLHIRPAAAHPKLEPSLRQRCSAGTVFMAQEEQRRASQAGAFLSGALWHRYSPPSRSWS
jgi:hypothetical protein